MASNDLQAGGTDPDDWTAEMSDECDTKRLLGDVGPGTTCNYGSSSSLPSEPQIRRKRRKRSRYLPCPDFSHLLSLAVFWKQRKTLSPNRRIHINSKLPSDASKFCSNRISTSKYNPLTFLPLFLFDQFRRYANLFFLGIALLQQIPGISPTGRYTTITPLFLVLLATAVKEIIEDLKRFKADNQVNGRQVHVLKDGKWKRVRWTKVRVGDIVRTDNHNFFPADLLLLSSSDPLGLCYVETSNLDGETNLKIRQAHPDTLKITQVEKLSEVQGYVECEGPNNRLYEFTGNIAIAGNRPEPIQPDNILLRGAQLRNTEWIHGLVLYTGRDSKLQQNATKTPLKRSTMDKTTNRQVLFMFLMLVVLSFLSAVCYAIWNAVWAEKMWYLQMSNVSGWRGVATFFYSILTFIILYNNLIPISLIITVEVVKLVQAYLINFDTDMYDETSDTPALARNSNLNEELGQVRFVFSDKTGTLTENIMEFKQCSIAGKMYSVESAAVSDPIVGLAEALLGHDSTSILHFFRVLALCHTVIPEWNEDTNEVIFRASSPDEGALVRAAKEMGVVFKARTPKSIIMEVKGKDEEYELLNLLEFNSTRKRMSVIVRFPDGSIKLLCKGADSVLYPRLSESEPYSHSTNNHLKMYALNGLRTLCVAERTIDPTDYEEWSKVYYAASTHLVKEEKERKLDEAAELVEQKLHLLGATAIEDKLQKDVPDTIATLRRANIKVWVLTGDKLETAVNIGYSSKQLVKGMDIMTISDQATVGDVQRKVRGFSDRIKGGHSSGTGEAALVIDGKSLTYAIDSSVEKDFLSLALSCKSIICCRVSPLQKAEVVKLVRDNVKDSITLAIGDGANDVSMIQAAHIGVGISGREGLQATLASDYAISQFRFLSKLLLVHGAWNYNRLAKVILYSFYKNICLYMIEFWFAFMNGFSGQPLFERWTIGLYNILFASLAPFALGILDQDASAAVRLARPHLYKASQQHAAFNTKVFWKWVGLSLFHSVVVFCAVYFFLWHELPFQNGKVFGIWYVGNTVYTSIVVTVNIKAGLETQYWTPLTHFAIWGSIVVWFLYVLVYSHFWPTFPLAVEFVGQDFQLFVSFTFYALFVLAPALAILPEFIYTVFKKTLSPTELDRARQAEIEGKGKLGDREMFLSVSYSASSGSDSYGDGLDNIAANGALTYSRGYAFSQEDHGSHAKGTSVQRRDLVRLYHTVTDEHR